MKKMMLTILAIGLCAFGAFGQVYTNDIADIKAETDPATALLMIDDALSYTNMTHSLASLSVRSFLQLSRYPEAYALSDSRGMIYGKVAAAKRGSLATAAEINVMIQEAFKVSENINNSQMPMGVWRHYKRSVATTDEYVQLCRDLLRVVETNAETQEFKSMIKSELEANQ